MSGWFENQKLTRGVSFKYPALPNGAVDNGFEGVVTASPIYINGVTQYDSTNRFFWKGSKSQCWYASSEMKYIGGFLWADMDGVKTAMYCSGRLFNGNYYFHSADFAWFIWRRNSVWIFNRYLGYGVVDNVVPFDPENDDSTPYGWWESSSIIGDFIGKGLEDGGEEDAIVTISAAEEDEFATYKKIDTNSAKGYFVGLYDDLITPANKKRVVGYPLYKVAGLTKEFYMLHTPLGPVSYYSYSTVYWGKYATTVPVESLCNREWNLNIAQVYTDTINAYRWCLYPGSMKTSFINVQDSTLFYTFPITNQFTPPYGDYVCASNLGEDGLNLALPEVLTLAVDVSSAIKGEWCADGYTKGTYVAENVNTAYFSGNVTTTLPLTAEKMQALQSLLTSNIYVTPGYVWA